MGKILDIYRPVRWVILFNIVSFSILYLNSGNKNVIYYALGLIGMIYGVYLLYHLKDVGDEYLFLVVSMLVSIGITMIFRLDVDLGIKQMIWFAGGMILFLTSSFVLNKMRVWPKLIYVYIIGSFLLFILTLTIGSNIQGATNWIVIQGYSFQPSEIIKILFIFFLSCYYCHSEYLSLPPMRIKGRSIIIDHRILMSVIAYLYMFFLVLQREWGGALLLFLIHITLLMVFEKNIFIIIANILLALIGANFGIFFVHHIQIRMQVWLDPWSDVAGKGYQIAQSLFAIGSGGFFGRGIGLGSPQYIPEVETDFIFSAICEEMGIFGGVAVVLLFFILVYRGYKIALAQQDVFYKALALGITVLFGYQTFIIIGGVIKLIPLTGITLPFISYGGSSLATSFIALGILQGISKRPVGEVGGEYELQ
ncbi:MAG: FtsW/RodA/SpoVE family cell cycle protein [Eubacteriales bacterium]